MIIKKLAGLLIAGACVASGTVVAQDRLSLNDEFNSLRQVPDKPNMVLERDFIYAESRVSAGLEGLSIRIADQKGQLVYEDKSAGEPLSVFISDLSLPDGEYHYVVTALYSTNVPAKIIPGYRASSRDYGLFKVEGGVIVDPRAQQAPDGDDQAFLQPANGEKNLWMNGLATVVDFFIGDASAADITSRPDGDFLMEDDSPSMLMFYGPNTSIVDGTLIWGLMADGGGVNANFRITGYTGGTKDVFTLESGAPANSLRVLANGDVNLAGGSVFIDQSSASMHIGDVTSPVGNLQLTGGSGTLLSLFDESTGGANIIFQSGNQFGITYSLITIPFTIANGAPNGSIGITADGTVSTSGSIHVGSTATPVGQFAITEPGVVRFEMIDSSASKRWRFTNAGDKFAINQVDTPGTEFSVFENGDATLLGILTENSDVNSKQDIVPVDSDDLLARVADLPIAEWSYIDAPNERHIGPMAQDFHAAFGLGRSDKFIATLDSSGIALAAIKALKAENDRISAENQALRKELDEQKDRLAALEESQVEIMATLSTLTAKEQEPLLVAVSANQ